MIEKRIGKDRKTVRYRVRVWAEKSGQRVQVTIGTYGTRREAEKRDAKR